MAKRIEVGPIALERYAEYAHLVPAVQQLRTEAAQLVPLLEGRTLWMVNSTAQGGGVAEMLPTIVGLLRDLGVATEWVVIEADDPAFFTLTKRLHNLIHAAGDGVLTAEDRALFEEVNRENARALLRWMKPGDLLAVHDPQPMPLASIVSSVLDVHCVWRCHIGVDEVNASTKAAWRFLRPYADAYAQAIFSAPEYIPDYFSGRAVIVYPALDPLAEKNRGLTVHKIAGVLSNAALAANPGPVLTPPYDHVAMRLLPTGDFVPANMTEDIGLLHRPIVTQVSRWDRLKGWAPLMEAFGLLKARLRDERGYSPIHRRRLELVRMVLAGPEPASVADDPEGLEVFTELVERYRGLDPITQRDLALVSLPMAERRENALMINAIQRTSSIVVQNSLREGFGLTITEGMWKGVPVLSNRQAVGPRYQVRDRIDGCLIEDPQDPHELADAMDDMLAEARSREAWGRSAQRHVHDEFLVFTQLEKWLRLLSETVRQAGEVPDRRVVAPDRRTGDDRRAV